jgi:iron complex transport system ATP-binding protein
MRLEAKNLSVALSGRAVLHQASLALHAGEVVGLLGPNGAGKSTLMRALAGLVESSGGIDLDGRDLRQMSDRERARLLAHLPQARVVAWPLSVSNVVRLGRMPWHGFASGFSARDHAICEEAMTLMDVAHLADRPATELSGGEQARVLAARAVAQDTPILLADEPASGLDPAHQITMMAALRELAARGRAVLVSLHDLSLAARWCDRILLLKEGRIVAQGMPAEVMTEEWLREVFGISAFIAQDAGGLVLTPTALAERAPR